MLDWVRLGEVFGKSFAGDICGESANEELSAGNVFRCFTRRGRLFGGGSRGDGLCAVFGKPLSLSTGSHVCKDGLFCRCSATLPSAEIC
jgi:hypothetical protein